MNARDRRRRRERRRAHAVGADSFGGEWLTENQIRPLLWRPWYFGRLDRPEGITWVWPIVQHACDVPPPFRFPELDATWSCEETATLSRYLDVVDKLLDSRVMNENSSLKVDLLSNAVTRSVPPDDATVGFLTRFRQIFSDNETASFSRVQGLLSSAAHDRGETDALGDLRVWKRTHRTLRQKHLRLLTHELAVGYGLISSSSTDRGQRPWVDEDVSPSELIKAYFYGDAVHWDSGRAQLDRWGGSDRVAASMEFEMLSDAYALTHFYAGFAEIVRRSTASHSIA